MGAELRYCDANADKIARWSPKALAVCVHIFCDANDEPEVVRAMFAANLGVDATNSDEFRFLVSSISSESSQEDLEWAQKEFLRMCSLGIGPSDYCESLDEQEIERIRAVVREKTRTCAFCKVPGITYKMCSGCRLTINVRRRVNNATGLNIDEIART